MLDFFLHLTYLPVLILSLMYAYEFFQIIPVNRFSYLMDQSLYVLIFLPVFYLSIILMQKFADILHPCSLTLLPALQHAYHFLYHCLGIFPNRSFHKEIPAKQPVYILSKCDFLFPHFRDFLLLP